MQNELVRQAAKAAGVRLWEVAECFGLNDGNFSRKLRKPFSADEEARALAIIASLREKRAGVPDAD